MLCKVEGCGRDATYKGACLCQKHYFQVRRNGFVGLIRKSARPRIEDARGYQFLHAPNHPLVSSGQIYVAEHRIVLFSAIGPAHEWNHTTALTFVKSGASAYAALFGPKITHKSMTKELQK